MKCWHIDEGVSKTLMARR